MRHDYGSASLTDDHRPLSIPGNRAVTARPPVKLTKRPVDALSVASGDTVVWDRNLPGFGVRVYASGRKVWCVQTRGPAGQPKRFALGPCSEVTAERARRRAALAIDRIKQGLDPDPPPPAVPEPTVADLAARYMEAHVRVNCRPGTVATFETVLRRHIVPELGHLRLADVDRAEVAALHDRLRATPWQANQTVRVLASMFRLAEAWGMTPPRRNPCRSVRRYREKSRERFLTPDEYRRLGRVLDAAEADGSVLPTAVPALRLLLLTGCRK
ncbi:MAG: integrase arm-type DNA-binding domain-containing protein, partial [Rhodospirillales bacterium]|nr:integrase arm-type DNA-binding domain-containing protein [Rhodospirillales bacterium]